MSVASADLYKYIQSVWDASGLDAVFENLRENATTEFTVFNDQEAAPSQPFPYCVMDEISVAITDRMSGGDNLQSHIRDADVRFNLHTRLVTGDDRTAKEIGAFLAEEVMKIFGGHPTIGPSSLLTTTSLDNGNMLIVQYLRDFGIRTGKDEYQWVVNYNFRLDIPVRV